MRYYLFLPNGYPEWCAEDESERLAWLMQHPLLGVYDNINDVIAAYDAAEKAALERIRQTARPNMPANSVRRMMAIRGDVTTFN